VIVGPPPNGDPHAVRTNKAVAAAQRRASMVNSLAVIVQCLGLSSAVGEQDRPLPERVKHR
jgi:hypothetical protein